MGVLLLKLAGPLQSWGAESRFLERKTRHEPTKSGVVGILAAALGRRREEPIDDLASLPIAVRIDQEGHYERDFQTAHPRRYSAEKERWDFIQKADGTFDSLPLSRRYYLSDAVFVVGVEVENEALQTYVRALTHPAFPLYLGRRSCPPSEKVLLGSRQDVGLMQAMADQPWQASNRALLRKHARDELVRLVILRDQMRADEEARTSETVRDLPLSFSQEHRLYGLRTVIHEQVSVPNPYFEREKDISEQPHDPMALITEVS